MSVAESLQMAGLLAGIMFIVMYAASFVLKFFLALNAPPMRRTVWTVGLAYWIAVVAVWFGGMPEYELLATFAGLPSALLLGWLVYNEFRERWYDNDQNLPEGTTRSNTNWLIGLGAIVGMIALTSIKVMLRG